MAKLSAVALQDIHFGPSQDNENINQTLHTIVYPYILKTQPDMICICGDDTDDRLSLNQSAARYYLEFINTISRFKKRTGEPCAVRFISGTESHQKGQLQALQFLTSDPTLDVKTIETVASEEYLGCKILYVPEEAVEDKIQYYQQALFSNNEYDLAFGHGLFDHIAGKGWGSIEERSLKGSPVWSASDFKCVRGGVFFGHIHIASVHKNFIYYGGSLTRNCQGEESAKGFLSIYYDSTIGKPTVEFIENSLAPKYVTITLTQTQKDDPVEVTIKSLESHVKKYGLHDLRVMIKKSEIDTAKLQILRKYFSDNRTLGVRIEVKKEDTQHEEVTSTGINQNSGDSSLQPVNILAERYPEIQDPTDWEFNSRYFAKMSFGVEISQIQLNDIISKARKFDKGEPI